MKTKERKGNGVVCVYKAQRSEGGACKWRLAVVEVTAELRRGRD